MDDIQPLRADDIQDFALIFALALGDCVGQGLGLAAVGRCKIPQTEWSRPFPTDSRMLVLVHWHHHAARPRAARDGRGLALK